MRLARVVSILRVWCACVCVGGLQTAQYDVRRLGGIVGELVERAATGTTTQREGFEPKLELLEAVGLTGRVAPSAKRRAEIEALCTALEVTQTGTPLDLMDGAWRVSYTTAPWPSSGKLGPFEFAARQVVDVAARSYRNELGGLVTLEATFEPRGTALRVSFRRITVGPFSFDFPSGVERTWRLTYADATLRVVRASVDGGRRVLSTGNDEEEVIFVLTRDAGDPTELKAHLLDAAEAGDEATIGELVDILAATKPATRSDVERLLDASYRVLWTTEAELLALVETPASTGAYQTIRGNELNNLVDFRDGSFLSVASSCAQRPPARVDFRFRACSACVFGRYRFNLPPVGAGYFDVLYIDDDLRISKDSRGDLQIASRRPLDRPFATVANP